MIQPCLETLQVCVDFFTLIGAFGAARPDLGDPFKVLSVPSSWTQKYWLISRCIMNNIGINYCHLAHGSPTTDVPGVSVKSSSDWLCDDWNQDCFVDEGRVLSSTTCLARETLQLWHCMVGDEILNGSESFLLKLHWVAGTMMVSLPHRECEGFPIKCSMNQIMLM